jgi:hypothetical protein
VPTAGTWARAAQPQAQPHPPRAPPLRSLSPFYPRAHSWCSERKGTCLTPPPPSPPPPTSRLATGVCWWWEVWGVVRRGGGGPGGGAAGWRGGAVQRGAAGLARPRGRCSSPTARPRTPRALPCPVVCGPSLSFSFYRRRCALRSWRRCMWAATGLWLAPCPGACLDTACCWRRVCACACVCCGVPVCAHAWSQVLPALGRSEVHSDEHHGTRVVRWREGPLHR